jgi:hypothetical protein
LEALLTATDHEMGMRKPLGRGGARVVAGAASVLSVDVVWPSAAAEPIVTATLSRTGLPERTTTTHGVRLDIPLD